MPKGMDVPRLIAEVKKRPILWDTRYVKYKDRTSTPQMWQEIALAVGVDVDNCKRKWKNLRDAYRAEVRRTEHRRERLRGTKDAEKVVPSKWVYFERMSFISQRRPNSYTERLDRLDEGAAESDANSGASHDSPPYESKYQDFCDIKMESSRHNSDEEDDMLFEQFKSVATPQAARRLSNSISLANASDIADFLNADNDDNAGDDDGHNNHHDDAAAAAAAAAATTTVAAAAAAVSSAVDVTADKMTSHTGGCDTMPNCACSNRPGDQVHFLETLEREEQQLMQSTRNDISRADSLDHIGDSDYNFLVSFMPGMKKMTTLQNLQFRASMSDLLLSTLAPKSGAYRVHASATPTTSLPSSAGETANASTVASNVVVPATSTTGRGAAGAKYRLPLQQQSLLKSSAATYMDVDSGIDGDGGGGGGCSSSSSLVGVCGGGSGSGSGSGSAVSGGGFGVDTGVGAGAGADDGSAFSNAVSIVGASTANSPSNWK